MEYKNNQKKIGKEALQKLLMESKLNISEIPSAPPVCLQIIDENQFYPVCSFGNFSMIIGKAKSRKTYLISSLAAAILSDKLVLGRLKGKLPKNQKKVLLFDTEQSRFHALSVLRRIHRISDRDISDVFEAFGIRKYSPAQRLSIIEEAIYTTKDIGVIFIDGIRDLIDSINEETQASFIANKLLKWTEERNIHIICVLHQNKADNNARGHVGTELQNKAETVISVCKSSDKSVVKAEYCRNRDFKPFAFTVDGHDIPTIAELTKQETSGSKDLTKDILPEKHRTVLHRIFQERKEFSYKALYEQIQFEFSKNNISFGTNKAKNLLSFYMEQEWVLKKGVMGKSKYLLRESLRELV